MPKEIQLTKPLQIAIYLTIILILVSSVFLFSTLNQDFFGKAVGEVCQADEDCGVNEHCENSICAENAPKEGTDGTQGQTLTGCTPECIEGQHCENNVCVPVPLSPTECVHACEETETCENNVCVPVPLSPTECVPACAQGEICNEGICETPLGCTDDLNCAENEICNKATGECVSTPTTPPLAKTIPASASNLLGSTLPSPSPPPIIPTPECTISTQSKDCTAGFACDNTGKCKTSCSEQTPADCQQGFLCFEG